MGFRNRCHIKVFPVGEVCILWVMKWELSLAASKMGETWSDGGPPLLGLALPGWLVRLQFSWDYNDPPESTDEQQHRPLTYTAIRYKYHICFSGEITAQLLAAIL